MKKILFCVLLLGVLLFSCSDNSTGPEIFNEFVRNYHLIVVKGDSLLQYLPDTIARIDSAIAGDFVWVEDSNITIFETRDFTHIVGEGKFILKEDLGIGFEENGSYEVTDPGKALFSINYPDDIPDSWLGLYPTIRICVTTFDSDYHFYDNRILTVFHSADYFGSTDSVLNYGIPLNVGRGEEEIGIIEDWFKIFSLSD